MAEMNATKECNACGEVKPRDEFYAARNNRDGLACQCKACYRAKVVARYHANVDKARADARRKRAADPGKYREIQRRCVEKTAKAVRARRKRHYAENKTALAEKKIAYRLANPERYKELKRAEYARNAEKYRAYRSKYYAMNREKAKAAIAAAVSAAPEKYQAHKATRKARKLNATPVWFSDFDAFVVEEAYALASKRAEVVGGEWQVDHIVPLAGRKVCGLHVGVNLQVLPATVNNAKRNRHDPWAFGSADCGVFKGV